MSDDIQFTPDPVRSVTEAPNSTPGAPVVDLGSGLPDAMVDQRPHGGDDDQAETVNDGDDSPEMTRREFLASALGQSAGDDTAPETADEALARQAGDGDDVDPVDAIGMPKLGR